MTSVDGEWSAHDPFTQPEAAVTPDELPDAAWGDSNPADLWLPGDDLLEPPAEHAEFAGAIEKNRAQIGGSAPDEDAPELIRSHFPSVDWEAAYQTDFSQVNWLPGRFMERGQQVTLVGDGKVGKSLFALDWAFRMAAGRSFLGDRRHEPLRVLYLDRENSLRDVVTRAQALGARTTDLVNLVYKQFPAFSGGLDASAQASYQLGELVSYHEPDIVLIDTVSRFIAGKENEADTWLQLYRLVHEKLKARGVACLRLDHFGKDAATGARGSSAKSQDVDHVWELSKVNQATDTEDEITIIKTTLKLARTHTRTGLGDDLFTFLRRGERKQGGMWLTARTRHEIVDKAVLVKVNQLVDTTVDELIAAGIPSGASRSAISGWLRANGRTTYGSDTMALIARELKSRG